MPELNLPAHKQQNKQHLKTGLCGWAKRQGQQGDKTGWNAVTTPYLNHCNNYSVLRCLQSAIATPASYLSSWSNSSFPVWGYKSLISASQAAGSWTLLPLRVTPWTAWVAPALPADPSSPSAAAPHCSSCQLLQPSPCSRICSRELLRAYSSAGSVRLTACFAKVPLACRSRHGPCYQQKLL